MFFVLNFIIFYLQKNFFQIDKVVLIILYNYVHGDNDQFQLFTLYSVVTFHTKIRLFQFENVLVNSVLFGQYFNYPSTSLFAYNVNLTSDVIVASLNFSIDGFFDSSNFNSLKVRVYLLVSQDNLFNNTFKSLKNMLYTYSKLYLKEQFVSFVMIPGYNCIDLLNLYNNALNNHFGFVNYIGIVVMPDDKLQTDVFCKAFNNRIKLGISYKKVNKPLLNVEYDGIINETFVNITFYLSYANKSDKAVNLIWEYLLPSFVKLKSEITHLNVVKVFSNNLKYKISNLTDSGIYQSLTATINNPSCLFDGSYTIDIPIKLYFENIVGVSWTMFRTVRKYLKENCPIDIVPSISNHLLGYYGRGIYLDYVNSQIYLCKNQHTTILQKSACYISKDYEIDIRIGAILGHHIISRELYAMHRNQKLYLVFSNMLKKWLAVTNHEFKISIANNLNWTQLKTLEGDSDEVIKFGTNQLMGNGSGLFFRKSINDIWNQSFKWHF
ncbi:uncharacterized protein LOC105847919 isoform X2 [Hydra vulgaris]|uniref:uncharacterized protein LOC105847919 isoform X2 n=1 Tax=Hydra vulgaris TaxID=6087 RepID=UPI001F5FE21E|nr:uncharacterized protein LOC105847919 isoform X2 [Hydra vulgaris]